MLVAEQVNVFERRRHVLSLQAVDAAHPGGGSWCWSGGLWWGGAGSKLGGWMQRHPESPRLINMYGITGNDGPHVTFPRLCADADGVVSPVQFMTHLSAFVLDGWLRAIAGGCGW